MTDDGSHFSAHKMIDWMKSVSPRHRLILSLHSQPNEFVGNYLKIPVNLKTLLQYEGQGENFFMRHCKSVPAAVSPNPAKLFKFWLEPLEAINHRGNYLQPSKDAVLNRLGELRVASS